MAYRLPPLNSLRLFEAAGRHLSFKLAAKELHLTPSAVSHGIQSLECWLGIPLFVRAARGLALTEAGVIYLRHVHDAIEQLAVVTDSLPGRRPSGRLSVSVPPTFGLRWLIPNLPAFNARHPDIEVSVHTGHHHVRFPRDGFDLAIRMGRGDWPDLHAECLVMEDLVPVCAPALAGSLRAPEDLADATLLHVVEVSEDWAAWARLAGVETPPSDRGMRFDTVHMALESAALGLGVAIGRLPVVAQDIAAGRLVPVLGPPVRCSTGYWLVTSADLLVRREVVEFRKWIHGLMRASAPSALFAEAE
ncbi:transcriptional regulator GcvA [Azospirillum canadense]|uniref:transcriptional regulator GcvA n=1 Tax=Azospirillum canadense TaxID=403962 RepID=UPI0022277B60|nr:transcriptional regulator GcvA [Azospirillum canadense]MCW2241392.1 DNA-binding transcriptional LysR family regulator [Azospirillum canadense]